MGRVRVGPVTSHQWGVAALRGTLLISLTDHLMTLMSLITLMRVMLEIQVTNNQVRKRETAKLSVDIDQCIPEKIFVFAKLHIFAYSIRYKRTQHRRHYFAGRVLQRGSSRLESDVQTNPP